MNHMCMISTLCMAALAGGCVVGSLPAGELPTATESDGQGSAAAESTGSTTEDPGMSGPAMTGTASGDPTGDGSGDDTTDGLGPPRSCAELVPMGVPCQPPGTTVSSFSVLLDGASFRGRFEETCIVDTVGDSGVTSTIFLQCGPSLMEIRVDTSDPHQAVEMALGATIDVFYDEDLRDEAVLARHLSLRDTFGNLHFAAIDASDITPPATFDYSPVTLQVVPTTCAQAQTECVTKQDAALEVGFDGDNAVLFDDSSSYVGQFTSYAVYASDVERIFCQPEECGYNYAEWFVHVMMIRVPEG